MSKEIAESRMNRNPNYSVVAKIYLPASSKDHAKTIINNSYMDVEFVIVTEK